MAIKTKRGITKAVDKIDVKVLESIDSKYKLIKEIKSNPLYKQTGNRDIPARDWLDINIPSVLGNRNKIVPGQLILFHYFEPKTKEELEYYDASPCTIFFGVFESKNGKRVLGFNIHYYPPQLRYNIMDKIFQMYRPVFAKYFKDGIIKEIDAFDYHYLIGELEKAHLQFGVREYIPELIAEVKVIPPCMWQTAVFTEGWFKKKTREYIMKYWKTQAGSSKV